MIETIPGAMSNALRLARRDVTCASYGAFGDTVVERLCSNPRVGFAQHFCSPTLRTDFSSYSQTPQSSNKEAV